MLTVGELKTLLDTVDDDLVLIFKTDDSSESSVSAYGLDSIKVDEYVTIVSTVRPYSFVDVLALAEGDYIEFNHREFRVMDIDEDTVNVLVKVASTDVSQEDREDVDFNPGDFRIIKGTKIKKFG